MRGELTTGLPYLDELLKTSDLARRQTATNAFNELCRLGCERSALGWLLAWYSYSTVELKSGHAVSIHSLDSWETALDPKDGSPSMTPDELEQVAERAKRLLADIKRLNKTSAVRELVIRGAILRDDLLAGMTVQRRIFQGLIRLPKLVKKFGPRKKPDRTRALANIYSHIRHSTRGYYDELLADILNALVPDDPANPKTGSALKQWRKRQGMIDKRGTRKS